MIKVKIFEHFAVLKRASFSISSNTESKQLSLALNKIKPKHSPSVTANLGSQESCLRH